MDFAAHLQRTDETTRDILGGLVTYTPGVGTAEDVQGIFDANHVRVEAGEAGVTSAGPAVFLRLSELPSDPEVDGNARVTVGGTEYSPTSVEKDGQGGVLLRLHRTS